MSKSRENNLTCSKFLSRFLECFLSLVFVFVGYVPFSSAQSCSVTSMGGSDNSVRACQLEDLRSLVNAARAACVYGAIAPYPFSDDPIIPNQTPISARHFNEIIDAVNGISSSCGPVRPSATFTTKTAGQDIIAVADFADLYNKFVGTGFCGDAVCQAGFENLTSCSVDCGGAASFYCNGVGGCYAAVTCPSGKQCYSVLADCQANVSTDCAPCTADCTGKENKYVSESWPDGCGGLCWGLKVPGCECAATTCTGDTCINAVGAACPGVKSPDCSCKNATCVGDTCSDGCGGTCVGTKTPDCSCATFQCFDDYCSDGCGGVCNGTNTTLPNCQIVASLKCGDNTSIWLNAGGNIPGFTNHIFYRCDGTCVPTDLDKQIVQVTNNVPVADIDVVMGQTYSYAAKFYNAVTGEYSIMSAPQTITMGPPPGADCSCKSSVWYDEYCSDGCGGYCHGTIISAPSVTRRCNDTAVYVGARSGNHPALDGYDVFRCSGTCTPVEADKIAFVGKGAVYKDTTAVEGQTYSYTKRPHFTDGFLGMMTPRRTITVVPPLTTGDCSCASSICYYWRCFDGCGGYCTGKNITASTCQMSAQQKCGDDNNVWLNAQGNVAGWVNVFYRCTGNCVPTISDKRIQQITDGVEVADTGVVIGQTYTYAAKYYNPVTGEYSIFSAPKTVTVVKSGLDCSCAANTCVGKSCSNGCGMTCAGTKQPSCACAALTCTGDTCSDGCGGTCAGTKDCDYPPITCPKAGSCTSSGFCTSYPETCACPTKKKPVCAPNPTPVVSCGAVSCPDAVCQCVD